LGEDDKHLNFRISFLLKENQAKHYQFILSTVVVINNFTGTVYFLPVKPFHSLIVPDMMRSIVKYLQEENYHV
ncbi:MAG TPA: DUF2867 domain-containing protein, partial [Patescibacteria group bacterium]|nr:DUF2867 domain-containing protein [Patescibacteria group bacterium]